MWLPCIWSPLPLTIHYIHTRIAMPAPKFPATPCLFASLLLLLFPSRLVTTVSQVPVLWGSVVVCCVIITATSLDCLCWSPQRGEGNAFFATHSLDYWAADAFTRRLYSNVHCCLVQWKKKCLRIVTSPQYTSLYRKPHVGDWPHTGCIWSWFVNSIKWPFIVTGLREEWAVWLISCQARVRVVSSLRKTVYWLLSAHPLRPYRTFPQRASPSSTLILRKVQDRKSLQ